ncbi:MAG: hypothetical protein QOG82_506 [Actinomycetota bacterium]|nr:hypothetical protein [Actinomycetota bacterium]
MAALVGASLVGPLHLPAAVAASGVIEGTVFRDWNQNGIQDPASGTNLAEPGVVGIEVQASDAAGTVAGPVTSGVGGHYSISLSALSDTVSSTFRVEFTIPAAQSFLQPGPVPATTTIAMVRNKTSVQFTKATGPVLAGMPGADFGVANPTDYCQANPRVVTPCYIGGPAAGHLGALKSFNYDVSASPPPRVADLATAAEIGSTWGVAWSRTTERLFAGAFTKRHAAYGAGNTGDAAGRIYVTDPTTATSEILITIPAGPDRHDYAANNDLLTDLTVWDSVGRTGLGDIDMAEDDSVLYVVNMFDRKLHLVDPGPAPAGGTGGDLGSFAYPDPGTGPTGCPLDPATQAGELNRNLVPGGLEVNDGIVYATLTCTAENFPGRTNVNGDLRGFVYTFDRAAGFLTQVANFPLNYDRRMKLTYNLDWSPWISAPPGPNVYPQPWLMDVEIDSRGFMIVGITDRLGHQTGAAQSGVGTADGLSVGDILRLEPTGATWTLERNGTSGPDTTGGANNGDGPGTGEFYYQEARGSDTELSLGGLAHKTGTNEVLNSTFDPINTWSGGVLYYSNTSGQQTRQIELFGMHEANTFGKAAGLGDLELLCDAAPIQVGNRAWLDLDGDGIQDPEEPPLANVTVALVDTGGNVVLPTAKTDASGNYAFTILPGATYTLRFDTSTVTAADLPSGYNPSPLGFTRADAGTNDAVDSDVPPGATTGTVAIAAHAPGHNDHTFDAGVIAQQRLGNLVWNDLDDDGKVDAGEPGIGGVTVELWRDANADGLLNSADALDDTTATSNTGAYFFTGLPDGTYFVAVPSGQAVLAGHVSSTGSSGGVTDNDDNGAPTGTFTSVSGPVSMLLAVPHPTAEKSVSGADDEAAANVATGAYPDNASDLTVDLGFFKPGPVVTTTSKPPVTTTTTTIPGTGLSRTGNDPLAKIVVASWMLWIGVGVVVADRRRRRRAYDLSDPGPSAPA